MTRDLEYPFTADRVTSLRIGDRVLLSGRVFTGRDRLHKFLFDGGRSPVDFRDGAMYHCGPVVICEGGRRVVRAAGPTTSMRHEPYLAALIERMGIRVVIGKGGMGDATRAACRAHGCVYLQAVGGVASLLAACVREVGGVHFLKEFGPAEALWDFRVEKMPAVVTMDARGRSLHDRVRAASRRRLAELLRA